MFDFKARGTLMQLDAVAFGRSKADAFLLLLLCVDTDLLVFFDENLSFIHTYHFSAPLDT